MKTAKISKHQKKFLSVLLAIVMVVSALPLTYITAAADDSGNYSYTVISEADKTCKITDYKGTETDLKIPESIDGYAVAGIGDCAFDHCKSLTSVTIGNSVTSIGNSAFKGCTSLTSIVIPNSVTSIDWNAFFNCTSLTSIVIPNSATSIGGSAFEGCASLTSVVISKNVTSIGYSAFAGCISLKSITVDSKNSAYLSIDGVLFNKDKTELICYPAGKEDKSYTIPDSVTRIESIAFSKCTSLTSITIPNSVTSIGDDAFEGCTSLSSVVIPNSVTEMGWSVFAGCSSLTSVTIGRNLKEIGEYVFEDCTSLKSITVDDKSSTLSSLDGVLFNKDKTELICYPAGKEDKSYTIMNSVTNIVYRAFEGCTLLSSVTIPDSVTSIGIEVFSGCSSLTGIDISNSVTNIGYYAFGDCTSLTEIVIPNSVTDIDSGAFGGCSALTSVKVDSKNSAYSSLNGVLFNKDKTELICYPEGKADKSYTIPNSVTNIDSYAFSDCTSLTSIVIPNSVTSIGSAFWGCTSLTSVTIPDSVTSIGWYAFHGCTSLTSIVIPNSVTSIGCGVFYGCTSLTSIVIPDSVTNIHYVAFEGCTSLTTIYGIKGSYAESYAKNNGYDFIEYAAAFIPPTDGKNGVIRPVDGSTTAEAVVTQLKSMSANISSVTVTDSAGIAVTNLLRACEKGMTFTVTYNDNTKAVYEIPNGLPGDLNGDGNVDAADAVLIQRYDSGLATLTAEQLSAADVTRDGTVDAADAVKIQRYDAGLISEL